jgi:ketosteroid isomerase-like protein
VRTSEGPADDDRREILEVRHAYLEAFNAQDIDGICATFTADVVAVPPDREAFVGREGLTAFYREMYNRLGEVSIEQDPVTRVDVSGDMAYTVGSYTFRFTENGAPVAAYGRSVEVWRRDPDGWKMLIDMWNSLPEGSERKRSNL